MDSSPLLKNQLVKKIRPRLGAVRRWLRSLPFRTRKQWEHLLEDPSLEAKDRELLRKVESRISYNDGMYKGNGAHYFKVGLSAIRCIEEALNAAQIAVPRNVLDLPCGHGRVLRFLVRRFPETRFTACDLDRDAVDFCAQTFDAEAIYSQPDLNELSLNKKFDLIWCGSLISHLNDIKTIALLKFFQRHLSPGGLVLFTTQGDRVVEQMVNRTFDYGIAAEQIPVITESYKRVGFGYTDYPYMSNYGIALTSTAWIRKQVQQVNGLQEVYFRAHGWDDHQDVFGFARRD